MKLPQSFYFKKGNKAILLLHAYSGSANDVRMLGRVLEKSEYTVYAPMFSGHGTLDPNEILAAGPTIWWQDVRQSLAFLQEEGFEEVAVFGLSMGGIFATALIEEFPQIVIGGGSFCSPIIPTTKENILVNFLDYSKKVLSYQQTTDEIVTQQLAQMEPKIQAQLKEIQTFSASIAQKLKTIHVPIFLAQAGKDQMIDPNGFYAIQKELQQTRTIAIWYAKSGHVLTVSEEHKQLEEDVLAFLNTLPWNEGKK